MKTTWSASTLDLVKFDMTQTETVKRPEGCSDIRRAPWKFNNHLKSFEIASIKDANGCGNQMLYIRKHTSSISEQSFKHSSAWCSSERALLNTWKHLFVIKLVCLINKYLLVCLFFSNLLLVWRIFSCLLVVVAVCLAQLDQLQQIQQERHLNQCFQRFFNHSFSCKTIWNQMCDKYQTHPIVWLGHKFFEETVEREVEVGS